MNKRWIFLDRDGTIIVEKNYLHDPDEVELLPGTAEGLLKLQKAGYKLVVLTNQSGIGRGYYREKDMNNVHERIKAILLSEGISIDGFFYCPHRPDENCSCRKPKTGLALLACEVLGFSLADVACVIGDKKCDIDFARNLGVPSILVMTGYGAGEFAKDVRGLYNVKDLSEAADKILETDGVLYG